MEPIQLEEPVEEVSVRENRSDVTAVEQLRQEIDTFYSVMRTFPQKDQSEIFMDLATMSARCSEIRCRIVRTKSQRLNNFRTKELDPLLEELDRQFRTWSRLATIRAQEWDMAGRAV